MFRLLGILTLGRLFYGRRHYRSAYTRGLFLGGLLGYFASRDFDMDRVAEDFRKTKRAVRDAIHRTRRELREARKAEERQRMEERLEEIRAEAEARRAQREARKAGREQVKAETVQEVRALPECNTNEAREIEELAADLERDARTAAMAADVPVIDFPEEDEKYSAARKYGYV